MIVTAIKTAKIVPGAADVYAVLDTALPKLQNDSIVAVTSKIVAICEGSIVGIKDNDKEALVVEQSDLYLPSTVSQYGHHFTITNNTLIAMAGIDESNSAGYYILWPRDSQQSANNIRAYLCRKHGLQNIGVIITDSTSQPLRRGTTGIALAHSGFAGLRNYIGQPDVFGKPLAVTQANISGGLAAAAVLAMGEGAEQTPIAVLSDMPDVVFQNRNPTAEELKAVSLTIEDDLFAPFWQHVGWLPGQRQH